MTSRCALPWMLLTLLAALLTACPPPPDQVDESRPDSGDGSSSVSVTSPDNPSGNAATSTADRNSGSSVPVHDAGTSLAPEPLSAVGKDTPKRVAYRQVQGGVFVPRCPACGETQPDGAKRCEGCSQVLQPWGRQTPCPACAATGEDPRSGDDRPCAACDGGGTCPYCTGGKIGDETCPDCGGNGRCEGCKGDGVRELTGDDFLPLETAQPGVCPTCVDGAGLCPECGSLGDDASGAPCLTCATTGVCNDCGGNGTSPHDRGDGACIVCDGHGLEIRNGDPPPRSARVWNLRMATGSVVQGTLKSRPSPNLTVLSTSSDGQQQRRAFMPTQVDPLTTYRVLHYWAQTSKQFIDVSQFARSHGFWALAIAALRRAEQLDPSERDSVRALRSDALSRRAADWLERAVQAARAGDRERALLLLQMVKFEAGGTGVGRQAKALEIKTRRQLQTERDALDESARTQVKAASSERIERVVRRAELRLERARRLLAEATRSKATDAAIEPLFVRAYPAAWAATRLLKIEAARQPPSQTVWPRKPAGLLAAARTLRAAIVASHASRAVAAGRFAQGAHLARRALDLNASQALANQALLEAERGLLRQGVNRATPPPK